MNKVLPAAVLLAACADGPAQPQLLLPEPVDVAWDDSFNGEDDGRGVLLPVDVLVYEGRTGEALADVEVVLQSDHQGAWLLHDDQVDDEAGCDDCDVLWDAGRDAYVGIDGERAVADAGLLQLRTDESGVARLYVFVDDFPGLEGTDDFGDVSVLVSAPATEGFFVLAPR